MHFSGYLPPVGTQAAQLTSASAGQGAQDVFDQLSSAEIEHIFAQANLAHHNHQQQQLQQRYQHY